MDFDSFHFSFNYLLYHFGDQSIFQFILIFQYDNFFLFRLNFVSLDLLQHIQEEDNKLIVMLSAY